jgi:hypothetical protein
LKIYSYVVARDYGFAPNPFFGVCTLATCKPRIRSVARPNDWVVGTGCAERNRSGYLVYAMRVTDALTFEDYFSNPRYEEKKPNLNGSKKRAFGDNIYWQEDDEWQQLNSHHSHADGSCNMANVLNDTQTNRMLISTDFVYFGGEGPEIPARFRDFDGVDICALRNHKSNFSPRLVRHFIDWIRSLGETGYAGRPLDWSRTP